MKLASDLRVIPCEITQKSAILTPTPSSISTKIGEPIAPHDRNMYAQF